MSYKKQFEFPSWKKRMKNFIPISIHCHRASVVAYVKLNFLSEVSRKS